jgi:hypothetical protein
LPSEWKPRLRPGHPPAVHRRDSALRPDDGNHDAGGHAPRAVASAVIAVRDNDKPPPPPQVADITPPVLTVVVLQRGLQKALRRGVPLRISSSEATNLLVKLRLRPRLARRLGLPRIVGTEALALGPVETAVLSARFSRRARTKLATLASFRLVVEVTGTDRSGNVAVWRSRIVLRTPA